MGNTAIWILVALLYGLICGGVFTWTSRRRKGTWPLFFRSVALFSVMGLIFVAILFKILAS